MPQSLICSCDFLKHLLKQSTLVLILTVSSFLTLCMCVCVYLLCVCACECECVHAFGRQVLRDQRKVCCRT